MRELDPAPVIYGGGGERHRENRCSGDDSESSGNESSAGSGSGEPGVSADAHGGVDAYNAVKDAWYKYTWPMQAALTVVGILAAVGVIALGPVVTGLMLGAGITSFVIDAGFYFTERAIEWTRKPRRRAHRPRRHGKTWLGCSARLGGAAV